MNKEAINIKNNEGTAAASNRSSEAEIYAVVAKVSKLKGLKINVIGNSLIISKEIRIATNKREFFKKKNFYEYSRSFFEKFSFIYCNFNIVRNCERITYNSYFKTF